MHGDVRIYRACFIGAFIFFISTPVILLFLADFDRDTPHDTIVRVLMEPEYKCRSVRDGPFYIADDKGYLCTWDHLTAITVGCCDATTADVQLHACDRCDERSCCDSYAHCVSCCQAPETRSMVMRRLQHLKSVRNVLYEELPDDDRFEYCARACRTNSRAVVYEQIYKSPSMKHCFAGNSPVTQPTDPEFPPYSIEDWPP
eukprot:Rmarinus@m.14506